MRHNKKKTKLTTEAPSCDWQALPKSSKSSNTDKLIRHKGNCRWVSIKKESYKKTAGAWADIDRYSLIVLDGQSPKYHVRYFEIAPGGSSSFEHHRHEHTVICLKGKGVIKMGSKRHVLRYLDIAYVSPHSPHQLTNPYKEPFGFLCIVNAKRDKPRLLDAK